MRNFLHFHNVPLAILFTVLLLGAQAFSSGRALASPVALTESGPIVVSGKDGLVLEHLSITSTSGPCLVIRDSRNITVRNSHVGTCKGHGIVVERSSNVRIVDSYIHPEYPVSGCCDRGNGIFAFLSSDIHIQGNVVAFGESNVQLLGVDDVRVIGNFLLNPLGPFARGSQVQVWSHSGTRSSNILVESNYALATRDFRYVLPEGQTDAMNFGFVDGVVVRDNYVTGGRFPSGCGLMADRSANNVQFLDNKVVDTGQCGIGISSGKDHVVAGNRVYTHGLEGNVGNVALYVWKQYSGEACGPVDIRDNVAVLIRPDGSFRYASIWNGGGCEPVTLTGNAFGQSAIDALTPIEEKLPAPASIPPQPYGTPLGDPFDDSEEVSPGDATEAVSPVPSGPIVVDGEDGLVLEDLAITSTTGPCLVIRNSHNITVRNSEIGRCAGHGIVVEGSSNVQIVDSYIHPESPNGAGAGIIGILSSNLLVQGNVVAFGDSNVRLLGVQDARVIGNFLLNPLGPSPRGNQVHVWSSGGVPSSGILIEDNFAMASRDGTYPLPDGQTNAFSLGYVEGAVVRANYITGGRFASGCGLRVERSVDDVQFLDNTVVETGQCGIGIDSGTNLVVAGNRVYTHGLDGNVGNVAVYVWKRHGACGPVDIRDNAAVLIRPDGSFRYASIWNGGGCEPVTLTNNAFGQAAIDALTPVAEKLPMPPAVPPRPYEVQVANPF